MNFLLRKWGSSRWVVRNGGTDRCDSLCACVRKTPKRKRKKMKKKNLFFRTKPENMCFSSLLHIHEHLVFIVPDWLPQDRSHSLRTAFRGMTNKKSNQRKWKTLISQKFQSSWHFEWQLDLCRLLITRMIILRVSRNICSKSSPRTNPCLSFWKINGKPFRYLCHQRQNCGRTAVSFVSTERRVVFLPSSTTRLLFLTVPFGRHFLWGL